MGCLAINEHAKTSTGPRSGKGYIHINTHVWSLTSTIPISSRVPELGPKEGIVAYTQKIYTYAHLLTCRHDLVSHFLVCLLRNMEKSGKI